MKEALAIEHNADMTLPENEIAAFQWPIEGNRLA
jgi:hypothetical protein